RHSRRRRQRFDHRPQRVPAPARGSDGDARQDDPHLQGRGVIPRRALALLGAAALLCQAPAGGIPTPPPPPSTFEPLAAEGAAYSRWFASVAEIEQPVQTVSSGLQGSLQAVQHSRNPERELAVLR